MYLAICGIRRATKSVLFTESQDSASATCAIKILSKTMRQHLESQKTMLLVDKNGERRLLRYAVS